VDDKNDSFDIPEELSFSVRKVSIRSEDMEEI
jgi:hypothetical protein